MRSWRHVDQWHTIEVTTKNVCHTQCVTCVPIEEVYSVTNGSHDQARNRDRTRSILPRTPLQDFGLQGKIHPCKNNKMYKIQWSNHTKEEATWETEDYMRKYYPDFLPKEVGT
jgi:hypothetical protein